MYLYILDSCADSDMNYPDSEKDQMMALDTLAAYHVQQARSEKNREKRKDYFAQVSITQEHIHTQHVCESED